ncbi:MAG: DUF2188 domain-containing protein [Saprospirales bacterium]|nr:DUF2188 domain-containing protein [Saprospirales bacterium]
MGQSFEEDRRNPVKKRRRQGRSTTHHQHVVPHPDGWAVKGEGNEKFTGVYQYQDDAIDRAREIAENYGSDVIIHRADGTIRDRRSYKKK